MDYKIVIDDFKHYVCKRCGSYFASLDDLMEHLKVCETLLEKSRKKDFRMYLRVYEKSK